MVVPVNVTNPVLVSIFVIVELVGNPAQLYENLMQIIDDNACE